jgi:hypothetical protein
MKFNLGVYNKLDKDDKTAYFTSFETSQKKSPFTPISKKRGLQKQKPPKKGPTNTPKRMPLPVWQDRDVKNRGTKLNP